MSGVGSEETEVCVVLMTAPDRKTARSLARALVEERLAACVNVVPGATSVYRWQGAVQEDEEVLLLAKTRRGRCEALATRVRDLHPYDLPEVLAVPAVWGSQAYLDWVQTESAG